MFVGSLILGFFITSSLLVNDTADVRSSQTKIYMALWMALWMVGLELIMYPEVPVWVWMVTIALIIGVFYLARAQTGVSDQQYLKAMIQHHSSAILTSDRILEKTDDPEVRKLAEWISKTQQEEIDQMNSLLERM
jgi:hypothetical protein